MGINHIGQSISTIPLYELFAFIFVLGLVISFYNYYYIKYFRDTTENFLKDLKENRDYNEDIKRKVLNLYNDSFEHPENIYNSKRYYILQMTYTILFFIFFYLIMVFFLSKKKKPPFFFL